MKPSRYNVFVRGPEADHVLLYNTLYGSLTELSADESGEVQRILTNPRSMTSTDGPIYTALINQKYLVDDDVDEYAIAINRKTSGSRDPNRLDVILLPTLNCNFSCAYCYETHRPSVMSDSTETAIKMWLADEVPRHKVTMLHWFGGEPLIAYKQLVSISRYLNDVANGAGVTVVVNVTSNGYLFSDRRISELAELGIHNYQITIDGPAATHNRLRGLRSGRDSFDRVFANVVKLARAHVSNRVSLRINFNHQNFDAIPELLEMFPRDVRGQMRVVLEPIFGDQSISATSNLAAEDISKGMEQHYTLAHDLGFDVRMGMGGVATGKLVYCYAERENQFLIDYKGDVFKCSVCDFRTDERVGYIRDDGVLIRDHAKWNDWTDIDALGAECRACEYLPICMGGCPKTRKQVKGSGECALVPTNASYLLKRLALGGFSDAVVETARHCVGDEEQSCVTDSVIHQ